MSTHTEPDPAGGSAATVEPGATVESLLRRCSFPPVGSSVTCAVSGGADSSALLVLAVAAGLDVTAVHVDHGLRPGSADEALVVEDLAHRLGTRFRAETARVAPGPDLEARARTARHAAVGPDALFGHTADDQAETVLLRLLRGTGPAGLAAMTARQHPILALRRSETHDLCRQLRIDVVVDPTNDSWDHRRNRVRHRVLPLLDEVAERDVVPLLCRLAGLAADQSALVDSLAADLDPTDAAVLVAAPEPLASSAVRRWWRDVTGSGLGPDAAALQRILDVAAGRAIGCDVVGGWRVARSAGRLRLVAPAGGAHRRPDGSGNPTGGAPVPGH